MKAKHSHNGSNSKQKQDPALLRTQLPGQLCVKTPDYYKDSVVLDLIQCNSPDQNQKVLLVCNSIEQAELLHNSQYLNQISTLIHNGLDRRQRIRKGKVFDLSNQKKCLITNQISSTHLKKLQVELVIFASPPKNQFVYKQVLQFAKNVKSVIVCYCTKQISSICRLQNEMQIKFTTIDPPQVQSQQQVDAKQKQMMDTEQVGQKKQEALYKLVFKNIDYQIDKIDLKKFLEQNNVKVVDIDLIIIKRPNAIHERRKTAFVTCKDKTSYDNAIMLHETNFQGRELLVYPYRPDKDKIKRQ